MLAKIKEWEEDSSFKHLQTIHFTKKQVGGGMNSWSHIINSFKHSSFKIWTDLPPPFKTTKKP
jgi:hypothetical protein